jgi:hypothetical protein
LTARQGTLSNTKIAQKGILVICNSPSGPKSTQKGVKNPFRSKIVAHKQASFAEVYEIEEDIIEVCCRQ